MTQANGTRQEDVNKLAALRETFQKRLYLAEQKLIESAMKKSDLSIRRAAAIIGCPPSSLQSCIESNPLLRRLYGKRAAGGSA